MRRAAVLAIGGSLLLAGCSGGGGSPRAERVRPASATADTTTTTVEAAPAVEPAADATAVPDGTPASAGGSGAGSARSSGGATGSGGNSSSSGATSPPYGGSFAPGEPHSIPPSGPASRGQRAHPWESYSVSPDGRTLTFSYYAGVEPCSVFDHVDVRESSTHVVVTIYERSDARPDQACVMMAQQKHARATLRSPLGSRRVVDGARSAPPPSDPPRPMPPGPPPPQPQPPPPSERPPCCKNPHPVRWESYSASSDGRTLTFTYWSGVDECSRLDHVDVAEHSTHVVVTIYERDTTNGNPCVAMAQQKHTSVTLQAPLGGRRVIDGAA